MGDSFFGPHDATAMQCAMRRPFLMLTAISPLAQTGNIGLNPGCVNTVVHEKHGYALPVYKNPKAAKIVPLRTNCLAGPPRMH